MTRSFVILAAAAALLAGLGQAQAQTFFGLPNGGTSFYGGDRGFSPGGVSPIPRTRVYYPSNYAPGTIVINTAERRLYLLQPGGTALRYGIGVGRDGFRWGGTHRIFAKKEWPGWTPPRRDGRRPDLPRYMDGGSRTRLALTRSISARRFTASMVLTNRKRSGTRSLRAASA